MTSLFWDVQVSQTGVRRPPYARAMRTKRYFVYITASKSRVIYVGMTGFLMSRILRHKAGEGGKFSGNYRVNRLVYCKVFEHVETAIRRETEIKKWRREKKLALIEGKNPTWEDLAADWGKQVEMTFRPVR
jgi:putative endonuclease